MPITKKYLTELTYKVIGCAIEVHKHLGPGLLESVYEKCFCHELDLRGIPYVRQQRIEICYEDLILPDELIADIIVADKIIVELKAQDNPHPVWQAQLLSYLKLAGKRLGFLINFHVTIMKNGIKRIVL